MIEGADPVFVLTKEFVEQGAAVIKLVFPDANADQCRMAAAGAFMAILSEREGGDVMFSYDENGPFFRVPTKAERALQ